MRSRFSELSAPLRAFGPEVGRASAAACVAARHRPVEPFPRRSRKPGEYSEVTTAEGACLDRASPFGYPANTPPSRRGATCRRRRRSATGPRASQQPSLTYESDEDRVLVDARTTSASQSTVVVERLSTRSRPRARSPVPARPEVSTESMAIARQRRLITHRRRAPHRGGVALSRRSTRSGREPPSAGGDRRLKRLRDHSPPALVPLR